MAPGACRDGFALVAAGENTDGRGGRKGGYGGGGQHEHCKEEAIPMDGDGVHGSPAATSLPAGRPPLVLPSQRLCTGGIDGS
jgi:hypothetical protein